MCMHHNFNGIEIHDHGQKHVIQVFERKTIINFASRFRARHVEPCNQPRNAPDNIGKMLFFIKATGIDCKTNSGVFFFNTAMRMTRERWFLLLVAIKIIL